MPGSPVDNVVVLLEVLVVADAAVGVGHRQVSGGVDGGQPAEEGVVCGGGVLLRGPVACAVVGVNDHQFPTVEVGAEHEGNLLHPVDDSARLWGDLSGQSHSAFYFSTSNLLNYFCLQLKALLCGFSVFITYSAYNI